MIILKRFLSLFVAASILFTGMVQTAQAAMVSSAQVAQATGVNKVEQDRERIMATLSRADVQEELVKRGVNPTEVKDRVAALTDEEVSLMAEQIDSAPAGGSIVGAIVLIFLVLLVTDILGLTKVYPFTRSIR
jgi:L-fucose isomerase-like protein